MANMNKIIMVTIWMVLLIGEVHAARFVDHKDDTITDSSSALMWQKTDDGVERVWDDAMEFCESSKLGGYEDWNLPKIHMLENLIDPSFSPTVNPVFVVKPSYYWSSTESRNSIQSAKYVNFFYGNTYAFSKDNTYYAICVRDASDSIAEPLTISFESDVKSKQPPFEIKFSSKITGGTEPYFFEWDFNDGDFSSLSNPSHTFKNHGKYNVVLTISDSNGAIAVAMSDVDVQAAKEMEKIEIPESAEDETIDPPDKIAVMESDSDTILVESLALDKDDNSSSPELNITATIEKEDGLSDGSETVASLAEQQEESDNVTTVDSAKEGTQGSSPESEGDKQEHIVKIEDKESDVQRETVTPVADTVDNDSTRVLDTDQTKVSLEATPGRSGKSMLNVFSNRSISPVQVVSSGEGVLAYSFTNGMGGDADWNKDDIVTSKELKGYLGMAIENLSMGSQEAVITTGDDDFLICADEGITHILTVGVDLKGEENIKGASYAGLSAESVALAVTEKCSNWKQLVLTGNRAGRNNIFRALLKMRKNIGPEDNLIFYYAGESEGSEKGLNLFTYDTLTELPGPTGILYEDLTGLLEEIESKNLVMLFEVGPHAHK